MNHWMCAGLAFLTLANQAAAQVERVWLSYQSADTSRIAVNWETKTPGDSVVHFGTGKIYDRTVNVPGNRRLHHVEISVPEKDVVYHYQVQTGQQISKDASFKSCPSKELRVAVVADWGYAKPDLAALKKDDVHLLLTAGDNVPNLHQLCGAGATNCTKAFERLIDSQPELFRSTPFMPALGNHDREIRPRGPKPPPEAVYDTNATAFREFFALPGDEWKWTFKVPEFDVQFIAADMSHLSDFGTTWQTCHAFQAGSEQLHWYQDEMTHSQAGFVVTLYNERNATVRSQAKGQWGKSIQQGSLAITGFGYFAERAEVDGFEYYNTALKGDGAKYPDPKSAFLASEHNYILLTFKKEPAELLVALKSLDGRILDSKTFHKRGR